MAASAANGMVTMRDGPVVSLPVLQRLWEIEARGASFVITETGFDVTPQGILTHGDRAFLLAHLDEAKRIVNYEADDPQSLCEPSPPSPLTR